MGEMMTDIIHEIGSLEHRLDSLVMPEISGGGVWNLIEEEELDGPAATIVFAGIPQTYRSLVIVCRGRTDRVSEAQGCNMRCNADAGNNYTQVNMYTMIGAGPSRSGARWMGNASLGQVEAANSRANCFSTAMAYWHGYASATQEKYYLNFSIAVGNISVDNDVYLYHGGGHWGNVNAITSLTLIPALGNFVAGTTVALYGVL